LSSQRKYTKWKTKLFFFLIHYMHSVYYVATSLVTFLSHAISYISSFCALFSRKAWRPVQEIHLTLYCRNVTWVTQHSVWSSPLSPGLPSVRKLTHCLHYEDKWQRTVEYSTVLIGTHHFLNVSSIWPTSGVPANWWTIQPWGDSVNFFKCVIWPRDLCHQLALHCISTYIIKQHSTVYQLMSSTGTPQYINMSSTGTPLYINLCHQPALHCISTYVINQHSTVYQLMSSTSTPLYINLCHQSVFHCISGIEYKFLHQCRATFYFTRAIWKSPNSAYGTNHCFTTKVLFFEGKFILYYTED
jgi:hypothetical protein